MRARRWRWVMFASCGLLNGCALVFGWGDPTDMPPADAATIVVEGEGGVVVDTGRPPQATTFRLVRTQGYVNSDGTYVQLPYAEPPTTTARVRVPADDGGWLETPSQPLVVQGDAGYVFTDLPPGDRYLQIDRQQEPPEIYITDGAELNLGQDQPGRPDRPSGQSLLDITWADVPGVLDGGAPPGPVYVSLFAVGASSWSNPAQPTRMTLGLAYQASKGDVGLAIQRVDAGVPECAQESVDVVCDLGAVDIVNGGPDAAAVRANCAHPSVLLIVDAPDAGAELTQAAWRIYLRPHPAAAWETPLFHGCNGNKPRFSRQLPFENVSIPSTVVVVEREETSRSKPVDGGPVGGGLVSVKQAQKFPSTSAGSVHLDLPPATSRPTGFQADGVSLGDAVAVVDGTTPVLRWEAGPDGPVLRYVVSVRRGRKDQADVTVARFHTYATHLTIPPGLLERGIPYWLEVTAAQVPAGYAPVFGEPTTNPDRELFPSNEAQTFSGSFMVRAADGGT